MASFSVSGSGPFDPLRLDDHSDIDSADDYGATDSMSSLGNHDHFPDVRIAPKAAHVAEQGLESAGTIQLNPADSIVGEWQNFQATSPAFKQQRAVTVPSTSGCSFRDAGILERDVETEHGYVMLVFNVNYASLIPQLEILGYDPENPCLPFEDNTGFVKMYREIGKLQNEAEQVERHCEYRLPITRSDTEFSLRPLIIAVESAAIKEASYRLGANIIDHLKEIAIAASLRGTDWFVQATADWPNSQSLDTGYHANRNKYLKSIVDYVAMTIFPMMGTSLTQDVRDLFHIVEIASPSAGTAMVVVRLGTALHSEDYAVQAMSCEMAAEARRPYGFSVNGICHFVYHAYPEALSNLHTWPWTMRNEAEVNHLAVRTFPGGHLPNDIDHIGSSSTTQDRPASGVHFAVRQNHRTAESVPLKPNSIDVKRIYEGRDIRTTIMLRNLPNRLTHEDLYEHLMTACPGEFDFLYVRIDFSNGCNVGYGFVNLISPQSVIGFVEKFRGFRWPGSEKVAEVSYATQQGREALISRFRNSSVMTKAEINRPKLYYPLGHHLAGMEEPFPGPDNLTKLQRSEQNAETEGLYETRNRRGGAGPSRRRTGMHDPQHTRRESNTHTNHALFRVPSTWEPPSNMRHSGDVGIYTPNRVGCRPEFRNSDAGGSTTTRSDRFAAGRRARVPNGSHEGVSHGWFAYQ